MLNSYAWIAPKPSPRRHLSHLLIWIRSQKTCMGVSHVCSQSLADGTRVTREWTEMKGDGVFTGEGHKAPPCAFLERCRSSKWIWGFFWEEEGVVSKGEKVSLPPQLTRRVILDCCLPTLAASTLATRRVGIPSSSGMLLPEVSF